jgi:ParB family chromosome partitioning protein
VKQTEDWIRRIKEQKQRKRKQERKSFSRDVRIAVNTLRKSIQMIRESGIAIETEENEGEDYLEVMIRVKNK